ncbi:MAG: hypothetical protein M0D55_14115 [Elusimicrobiota bacterium]|nr:MAG: hypothetical protein M0D55_14115 [Elusimicrobiota bacterium]
MKNAEAAPKLKPAADFARLDWSIPEKNDISPKALGFIRQAIAARTKADMSATWIHAQAAMNADPGSTSVQKFYALAQADRAKHADTAGYIRQAVEALEAGRGGEAVAWAQKACDRSPSDDTYGILQDVRRRSATLNESRARGRRSLRVRQSPVDRFPYFRWQELGRWASRHTGFIEASPRMSQTTAWMRIAGRPTAAANSSSRGLSWRLWAAR